MASIKKWSDALLSELKDDVTKQGTTLLVERHPDYPAYLLVNSFDPFYKQNLNGLLNEYDALPALRFGDLIERADQEGYTDIAYVGDLDEFLNWLGSLDEPYPYDLSVSLKTFQVRGFNFTKDLPSAIINWSTGTGKSVYSVARAKYLLELGQIDKVVVLSKSHNKINWQRTFARIGSMGAAVDDDATGTTPALKRQHRVERIYSNPIFIINYEKLRFRDDATTERDLTGRKRPDPSGDGQELLEVLKGKRVLWLWDEMPNKMKSMSTGWYKGAQKILNKTKYNYQVELTAKKLDTNPENVYSCTKLLDKTIWPNVAGFRREYAKRMSQFSPWQVAAWDSQKLPELGMRLSHMTHIANKYTDPKIRAEFPEDHWEDVIIDMSDHDRMLYDAVQSEIISDLTGNYSSVLTKILPLQLICNNPALINRSEGKLAEAFRQRYRFIDDHCAKLAVLKDMLDEIDGKIVLFSMFHEFGSKMLAEYLTKWDIPFVLYSGNAKQKQAAQDRFRSERKIKVFVSSDTGSDSIDLEQATTVINYDLPWNHSTLIQRVNRISRLTSEADHVFYFNLITARTLEERKLKILERKRLYEEAIDSGISENSELITHGTVDELRWILGV
jgi:hypothetical protein